MVDQIFVFRSGKHNSQIDKSEQNRMLKPAVFKFGINKIDLFLILCDVVSKLT